MPISFQNVSFVYSPKTPFASKALQNISFAIDNGQFVAIVGKTGSGKSTIAQLLNALLTPTEGSVVVDDFTNEPKKRKKGKEVKALRKHVGLVFQFPEYQLFEETVEKDVSFGPRNFGLSKEESLKKAHDALRMVGLDESFDKRSPFDLSGGEKRKVAIAGILALDPEVLIVDEPTSGLDPKAAEDTMALFKKINESGKTVLFVTHDMDLVLEYASLAVVVNDGKVEEVVKPSMLFGKDLSSYSLSNPQVFEFALRLKEKGFTIDFSNLRTVSDLGKAIADAYREKKR